ncbi:hypothetical protein IMSAGC020_00192 [Lachnospiraceae bacterium]|jgi:hypothetical protein|nr:hypothetical protein IMSAGC020_00192 [Lachnospiraceae bacterium]
MDLYRGKTKMTGDWIIGAVVCIGDKAYILCSETLFPERPAYHSMAVGAGLEDAGITDRYEAAAYGWTEALERYEENFPIWMEVIPETVTRCTGKHDMVTNVLFEGDVYQNPDNLLFEICYGKYMAFCPADKEMMENVGFFAVSRDTAELYGIDTHMPLGMTEDYAILVGNIFDNPELMQEAGQEAGKEASQQLLMPAT